MHLFYLFIFLVRRLHSKYWKSSSLDVFVFLQTTVLLVWPIIEIVAHGTLRGGKLSQIGNIPNLLILCFASCAVVRGRGTFVFLCGSSRKTLILPFWSFSCELWVFRTGCENYKRWGLGSLVSPLLGPIRWPPRERAGDARRGEGQARNVCHAPVYLRRRRVLQSDQVHLDPEVFEQQLARDPANRVKCVVGVRVGCAW